MVRKLILKPEHCRCNWYPVIIVQGKNTNTGYYLLLFLIGITYFTTHHKNGESMDSGVGPRSDSLCTVEPQLHNL